MTERRDRRHQRLGIGVRRTIEDCIDRSAFDDLAEIHDQHAIAQQPDDIEIVADKEVAHAEPAFQIVEQLQDHHLHRNVECRSRLVEDQ